MQLSIDVLPAPFGPMMARISPFRMSKDTSVNAFTPPKRSDTSSTARSTSPFVSTGWSGALIAAPPPSSSAGAEGGEPRTPGRERRLFRRGVLGSRFARPRMTAVGQTSLRGLQHRRRRLDRVGLPVHDLHARRDDALAAVLEGDLGRYVGLGRAVVEGLDQRRVALGDEAAADFLGARELAVVGVELLVQDKEAFHLRAAHARLACKRPVHLVDVLLDHVVDERMAGELLVGAVGDAVALGPVDDGDEVDVD